MKKIIFEDYIKTVNNDLNKYVIKEDSYTMATNPIEVFCNFRKNIKISFKYMMESRMR